MSMKNHIRYLMMLAVILLSSAVWAEGQVNIIGSGGGQVTYKIEGTTCTLTATPAQGYYITADYIQVVKTIEGGHAGAPRRVPDVAEPVTLTATDPDANPTTVTTYSFPLSDGDYDYEVTANFQDAKANQLLLVEGRMVTEENRRDILSDGGSVQFDGKMKLVLTSTSLKQGVVSWLDQLTLFLQGESTISVSAGAAIQGNGGGLTFTTEGNDPGKLSLKTESGNASVVTGFAAVNYEQNLTLLKGALDTNEAEIGTPVTPLVDDSGQTNTVNVDGGDSGDDLGNVIINNVLYTLDSDNDDGIGQTGGTKYVVLGSTMAEDDVEDIINNYQPGTQEFADHFAGLTFMVPAGYGTIIINARTGEEGVLCVKIGQQKPYIITGAEDFTDYSFPYACTEATYVFVYSTSPRKDAEAAADHRAGKKTTVTVGVGSVGVTASATQASNGNTNIDGETVVLSDDTAEWDLDAGTFTATSPAVNAIADDAFAAFPFLKYIDLSKTSITGLEVSREHGPFAGVSKNTFIYLPAGNSTTEPNVVIGSVSERVVLDGQMKAEDEESFGLACSFMAQQVVFDRPFAAGEVAAVYLPFGLRATEATAFGNFYAFDAVKDGNVSLQAVKGDVTAHVPYLFKSNGTAALQAAGVMMSMPETASSRAPEADPDGLYGTYEFKEYDPFDEDVFRLVIAPETGALSFERLKEEETIRPFECYLYAYGQTADHLGVEGEGITGIESVTVRKPLANDSEAWCNLSGQRLQTVPSQKGVYIHQGQKVVIK